MYKVLIRPLEVSDAEISWKWRHNPKIWEFTGSKPVQQITHEIERDWIQKVIADQTMRRFAILADDVYIGNAQLTNITNESAQYHLHIGETSYWGKGIGKQVANLVLKFAFNTLCVKEVYSYFNPANLASIKACEKNGFKFSLKKNNQLKYICNLSDIQKPTVSVFVMVYNHGKYLAECLDGLLMQKCNFTFDIVVGEDCSTDNSREILLDYQNRYPGKFKLLLHKTNIGAAKNQMEVFKNCEGNYIAMCEGDDYWIDPIKLQKQVDFLKANKDYVLTHSDIAVKNSNGNTISNLRIIISKMFRWRKDTNIVRNLVKGNYIMTLTVVIVKNALFEAIEKISENDNQVAFIDYTLFLELSKLGKIHYQEDKTAVYRVLPNSASNSINLDTRLRYVESTINISRFYNQKFSVGINNLYFDRILLSAQLYEFAKRGLVNKFSNAIFKGIKSDILNIFRLKNYYSFIILILSKIK